MSDEIKINRVTSQPSIPQAMAPSENSTMVSTHGNSKIKWFILIAVVIVLGVLAVLFRDKLFTRKQMPINSQGKGVSLSSQGYQAVFLTNGQVYFGKIISNSGDYLTLQDIYYLQVVQPPLQGQQQAGQTGQPTSSQPQISLIKLGSELHGPEDEMHISKNQILFYENLKESGQVVQAIINDKNKPK